MRLLLKKLLPRSVKVRILRLIYFAAQLQKLFKYNRWTASVYYTIVSNNFGREHKSVLSGKAAYYKNLKAIGVTSALLRRNIHRLEKGLIMQPRRGVFAEAFIVETVDIYERAVAQGTLDFEEQKWATDVLAKYFDVVNNTAVILHARKKFNNCAQVDELEVKYIPYQHSNLPEIDITFNQLHSLFVKRRSVRWYQNKEVPIDLIDKAISLASLAPSACNRQPYKFYVTETKQMATKIAKCAGGTPGWVDSIQCIIVIVGDLSAYPSERDRHAIYIDSSLAAMQLMLAFETLGLSTCSINWPDIEKAERKMDHLLSLKQFERPIMLLSVGFAAENGGIPFSQKKTSSQLIRKV
jgi:nitroreductase